MKRTTRFELLIKGSVILVALGWLIFVIVKYLNFNDANSFATRGSALKSIIFTSVFIALLLITDPLEVLLKIKDNDKAKGFNLFISLLLEVLFLYLFIGSFFDSPFTDKGYTYITGIILGFLNAYMVFTNFLIYAGSPRAK